MSRRLRALALTLVALVLVTSPVYLSTPAGPPSHPTFERTDASECNSTIAYADLPPRAQHSFDITSHGDLPRYSDTLYADTHSEALDAFLNHDCLRRDDEHFRISLIHHDGGFPAHAGARFFDEAVALLGVLGLLVAGVLWVSDFRHK